MTWEVFRSEIIEKGQGHKGKFVISLVELWRRTKGKFGILKIYFGNFETRILVHWATCMKRKKLGPTPKGWPAIEAKPTIFSCNFSMCLINIGAYI